MKFRTIDIPRTVYQILRPNYAIRNKTVGGRTVLSLNYVYRFLLCCLLSLNDALEAYYARRRKAYMIASCMPIQGQAQLVLNSIYGKYGFISLIPVKYGSIYLYDAASATPENQVYLYTDDREHPVYMGYQGASSNTSLVTIPADLQNDAQMYSDFVATLRSLVIYGITYEIQIQQ